MKNTSSDLDCDQNLPAISLVDSIIEMVKGRIRRGLYAPGQRLIAAEIQANIGCSRGPVREALRRLAAEGVIDLTHQKGARVRAFTTEEMIDAFGVREALEGFAARLAAGRPRELSNPTRLLALEEEFANLGEASSDDFRRYNQRFHALLLDLCANEQLAALIRQLSVPVYMPQFFGYFGAARAREARTEHRAVVKAIIEGHPDAAEHAMRMHIRATRDFLIAAATTN